MDSIFITGAASGIGRQTALLFASRGWFVGLFDLDEQNLIHLADEVGSTRCCWSRLDVTDYASFTNAVARFSECTNGTMNVLFNSAGILHTGPFIDVAMECHTKILDVNVKGTMNGIMASFPLLRTTSSSRIITMSSASAFYGVPDLASYSLSKAAIKSLTESLSIEFEQYDILVSDVMPLFVDTPMITSQDRRPGTLDVFGSSVKPEQIAEFIWQASHRKRLHWVPSFKLKFLAICSRFLPFVERPIMKFCSRYTRKSRKPNHSQ